MKLLLTSNDLSNTAMKIDDEAALKVIDDKVAVISESKWKLYE